MMWVVSRPLVDGRTVRYQHRRPELLAAAADYVLNHGFAELSLRPLAKALGVSHATLLRHFSSKEELLLEVVGLIRTEVLGRLARDSTLAAARPTTELVTALWDWLCQPREQRQFILLFEVVGRRTRASQLEVALARSIVNDWLTPLADSLIRDGWASEEASALATVILANIRGLQLDLMVTGDQARVNRAFVRTIDMLVPTTADAGPRRTARK